jgi:hypothetical protein
MEEFEGLISSAAAVSEERFRDRTEFPAQLSDNNPNFRQTGFTPSSHRVTRSMAKRKQPEEESIMISADAGTGEISKKVARRRGVSLRDIIEKGKNETPEQEEETAASATDLPPSSLLPLLSKQKESTEQEEARRMQAKTLHNEFIASQIKQLLRVNFSPIYNFASMVSSQSGWDIDDLILGISKKRLVLEKIYEGELQFQPNQENTRNLAVYLATQLEIPIEAAMGVSDRVLSESENMLRNKMGVAAMSAVYAQNVRATTYDTVFRSPLFSSLFNSSNKMLLTPKFYGHLSIAHSDLKQINPRFKLNDLMFTDDIQEQFAKYVAAIMMSVGARGGEMNTFERGYGKEKRIFKSTPRWAVQTTTNTIKDGRAYFRNVEYCGGKLKFISDTSSNVHGSIRGVFHDAQTYGYVSTQRRLFPGLG